MAVQTLVQRWADRAARNLLACAGVIDSPELSWRYHASPTPVKALQLKAPPPRRTGFSSPFSMKSVDEGIEEALSLDSLGGLPLTRENIERVLDDEVRPGLNADGGDITLIDIRGGDIYVKLVGSCASCPSAILTMKMGVERMLQDSFPSMGQLLDIEANGGKGFGW